MKLPLRRALTRPGFTRFVVVAVRMPVMAMNFASLIRSGRWPWRPPPLVGFYEVSAHGELVEENAVGDEGWFAHHVVDGDGSHFSVDVAADGCIGAVGCG